MHVIVEVEGYAGLATQLFDSGCEYLGDDCVCGEAGVGGGVCVEEGDSMARWALEYDFVLSEA